MKENKIKKVFKRTFLYDILNEYKYKKESKKNISTFNKFKELKILDDFKTVDEIIEKKKSFARYGDGEFRWMLNDKLTPKFQRNDKELSRRLIDVIKNHDRSKVLIGISKNMQDVSNIVSYDKFFWRMIVNEFGEKILTFIDKKEIYGNASLTRFYIGYKDKSLTKKRIENIKRIWNERDIVIIEGEFSRLGVGNDFFDNARNIERIIAPAKDAFDKCDEIETYVKDYIDTNKLIILALGPTATIMAADLSKYGYQSIDLGHADLEYEWYLSNAKRKISISGKAVNESDDKNSEGFNIHDEKYEKSILIKFV